MPKSFVAILGLVLATELARAQDPAPGVPLEQAPSQDIDSRPAPPLDGAPSAPTKAAPKKSPPPGKAPAKKAPRKGAKPAKKKRPAKKKKRGDASSGPARNVASLFSEGEIAYAVTPVEAASTPAPIPVVETSVYSERTSFEGMLKEKAEAGRRPAGLQASARIIAVKRELGLTKQQADQAPQDLILNGGTKAGLNEGMKLSLMRKIPVLDPYRENQQSEIEVEFGQVRVIHVQENVAVARVEKIDSIRDGMAIGTRGPLVGDFVGKSR